MDYVIIQSMDKEVEEILTDIDYGSFSYDYEKNTSRAISFTVNKTKQNAAIFDLVGNEAILTYQGQQFVIKNVRQNLLEEHFQSRLRPSIFVIQCKIMCSIT